MSLYRRGTTWWTQIFVRGVRVRQTLRTRDKRTALRLEARLLESLIQRDAGIPAVNPVEAARPFGQHVRDWAEAMRARRRPPSALYIRKAVGAVNAAAAERGWARLGDVSEAEARAVIGVLEQRVAAGPHAGGLSGKTLNNIRGYHVAFWAWLVGAGRAGVNPFEATEEAVYDPPMQERALTAHEARLLLSAPAARAAKTGPQAARLATLWERRRTRYAFEFMVGVREGGVERLERRDFSLDVANPHVRVRAEINKSGRLQVLPLVPELVTLLRRLPAFAEGAGEPSARVFPGRIEWNTFQRDLSRAGIDLIDEHGRGLGPHALRRSLGTRLAAAGAPIDVTQAVLGHRDRRTTERHYVDRMTMPLRRHLMAVADVFEPPVREPMRERVAATGTDGRTAVDDFVAGVGHGVARTGTSGVGDARANPRESVENAGESHSETMRLRGVEPPWTGAQPLQRTVFERVQHPAVGESEPVPDVEAAFRKIADYVAGARQA